MEEGVAISGASSSIASLSNISNPSQNLLVVGGVSLGAAFFFFSADVVLLFPLRLVPCGGEFASRISKSGSFVKFRAAPLLPP